MAAANSPTDMSPYHSTDKLVVLCTCPDEDTAAVMARELVRKHLAACVNVQGRIRSIYRWNNEVTEDTEALMVIKTTTSRYRELERVIVELHPYELPEIIAVPIEQGFERYLAWIQDSTS